MKRRAYYLTASLVVAFFATAASAQTHTIRVQFATTWDAQCVVSWANGSATARPGAGRNYDQSFSSANPGSIRIEISPKGGKPVEVIGNWSIQARCIVSVDGRQIANQMVSGYYPRNKVWSYGPYPVSVAAPTPVSTPISPAPRPAPVNTQPVPPSAPATLMVTPQLQAALLTSASPFLGSGDTLTSASPFLGTGDAGLTSASPFTMPIGNNLVGGGGASYSTQSLGGAQQTFQKVYGRQPSPAEAAAVAKLQMITQAYVESFGRAPQSRELQYWAGIQNLNLPGLEGANSNWLRQNRSERDATIQRAFQVALHRNPNAQELPAWDANVMRSGTLFKTLVTEIKPTATPTPVSAPRSFQVTGTVRGNANGYVLSGTAKPGTLMSAYFYCDYGRGCGETHVGAAQVDSNGNYSLPFRLPALPGGGGNVHLVAGCDTCGNGWHRFNFNVLAGRVGN